MLGRILLALNASRLQGKLKTMLLSDSDAMVETVRYKKKLWQRLGDVTADLIVISESMLPDPVEESIHDCKQLPDSPALAILTGNEDAEHQARLLAAGCDTVLLESLPLESLRDVLETLLAKRTRIQEETVLLHRTLSEPRLSDFVSTSPAMMAFMAIVRRVVGSDTSLLFLGETGVGKERLARAIHGEGPRAGEPFIAVNCGAFPESLLESELFGHEQGAFTGATRARRGCFELAHGGTIFLDEIGDMPMHLQVKLLRVLQEREIVRVGGERPLTVDVRVMAATNRDIHQAVQDRSFRQDLYYRLSVVTLTIPPLRERIEDIPELVENYIHYLRPRINCEVYAVERQALEACKHYDWPGNVRELINIVERAMLLAETEKITLADLPAGLQEGIPSGRACTVSDGGLSIPADWLQHSLRELKDQVWDQMEQTYLDALLQETGGRIGQTAERAGIEPRSVYSKMKRYGLRKEDYKSD